MAAAQPSLDNLVVCGNQMPVCGNRCLDDFDFGMIYQRV